MNALDYLKRGYSFVLNDDHPFRTAVASLSIPVASAVGIGTYVYEEPATTPLIAPTTTENAAQKYIDTINFFSTPSIEGQAGWQNLDDATKDFSRRVILDPNLSETDITKIIAHFNESTRFKPVDYLWLKSGAGKDMNFVQECRIDTLQATGGNIVDFKKSAEEIYACAVKRESTNVHLSILPEMLGGIIGFMFLLGVGGSVGESWERDFKYKRRREEEEKERQREANRLLNSPKTYDMTEKKPEEKPAAETPPAEQQSAPKARPRTLNF